jgi:Neuraminidase (sialidase)
MIKIEVKVEDTMQKKILIVATGIIYTSKEANVEGYHNTDFMETNGTRLQGKIKSLPIRNEPIWKTLYRALHWIYGGEE